MRGSSLDYLWHRNFESWKYRREPFLWADDFFNKFFVIFIFRLEIIFDIVILKVFSSNEFDKISIFYITFNAYNIPNLLRFNKSKMKLASFRRNIRWETSWSFCKLNGMLLWNIFCLVWLRWVIKIIAFIAVFKRSSINIRYGFNLKPCLIWSKLSGSMGRFWSWE